MQLEETQTVGRSSGGVGGGGGGGGGGHLPQTELFLTP